MYIKKYIIVHAHNIFVFIYVRIYSIYKYILNFIKGNLLRAIGKFFKTNNTENSENPMKFLFESILRFI